MSIHVDVVLDWSCWGREKILSFLILQLTSKISLSHFHLFFRDRFFLRERPELFLKFEVVLYLLYSLISTQIESEFLTRRLLPGLWFFHHVLNKIFLWHMLLAISSIKFYVLYYCKASCVLNPSEDLVADWRIKGLHFFAFPYLKCWKVMHLPNFLQISEFFFSESLTPAFHPFCGRRVFLVLIFRLVQTSGESQNGMLRKQGTNY